MAVGVGAACERATTNDAVGAQLSQFKIVVSYTSFVCAAGENTCYCFDLEKKLIIYVKCLILKA